MSHSYNRYLTLAFFTLLDACSPPVTIHKKTVEKIMTKTIAYSQSMTDSYLVGKPSNKLNILWVANAKYSLPSVNNMNLNQALYNNFLQRVVGSKHYNIKMNLYSDSFINPRTYFYQVAPFANPEMISKNQALAKCHLFELFGGYENSYDDCADEDLALYLKDMPATYNVSSSDYSYTENLFSIATDVIESELPFTEGISKGQKLVIIFSNAIYWQYNDNETHQKIKEQVGKLKEILKKRWRLHNVKIISLHVGKKSKNERSFCGKYVKHNKNFEKQIISIGNPDMFESFLNLCDYINGYQQDGTYQDPTIDNQQTLNDHTEEIWDYIMRFKSAMILSEKPDEPENIRIDICGNVMSLESSPFTFNNLYNQLLCKDDSNCIRYSEDSANTCAANINVNYHAAEAHIVDLKEIDDADISNSKDDKNDHSWKQE